jgi:uncharacterized protein YndB with AHSA1/START domain
MQVSEMTRIERSTFIRAPRARVWKAIADSGEFGLWFQVKAEGAFTPGTKVRMTSTHPGCMGLVFYVTIEQVVPEQLLSWRWYPGAAPDETEPPTTVEFRLADAEGGTTVTVTESGFDRISLEKRAVKFKDNDQGWAGQLVSLAKHLSRAD